MMNRPSNRSEPGCHSRRSLAPWIASLWAGVLVASAISCHIDRPATFATASALPSGPRRPDGVAVDLQGSMPPASTRAATQDGLVALREPVDMTGALQPVRQFFESVSREDGVAMRGLLTFDAQSFMPSGPGSSGMRVEDAWDRRFSKFDYKATGPEPVYRETSVETYRYKDLDEAEGDRPQRPMVMDPQDVLIRVPIEIRRVGVDRVFGDEILFVVRRVEGAFRIRALVEDFQPY
jgi:hypothetical protein